MGLNVRPSETFAVLVGVETYAGEWPPLDGPANDAARYAQWLCAHGVPPDHIYAFVSLKHDPHEYDFPPGCHIGQANEPAISNVIKHVIPALGGRALFFLWGGHGIVDDDRERHLFLSDATSDLLESIAVPSLLRFLRSTSIKGFEHQWFVIDTCANRFRTAYTHLALARLGLPDLMDARRHAQYVMFAASVGEKALNLSAERRGLFAGVVLDALGSIPDQQWPPDMEAVSQRVNTVFADRGARQVPEYRWYKMGDQSPSLYGSVSDEGSISSPPAATDGLTARAPEADALTELARPLDAATGTLTIDELHLLFELAVLRGLPSPGDVARVVLQPGVIEVITRRVIRTVLDELMSGRFECVADQSLLRLRSYEFVQADQRQRLLAPIVSELAPTAPAAAARLRGLILASRPARGYTASNLVNLLATIETDLSPLDLSGSALRDADLREVTGHGLDLRGCDLSGAAFRHGFTSMLAVDFSADGQLMATANADGIVRVWRVEDGQLEAALHGHTDWTWAVAFIPGQRLLASSGDDGTVRIWDLHTRSVRHVLPGHSDWVRAIAVSPDGRTIASGSQDGTIRLWDVDTGTHIRTLIGHQDQVWSVSFNPLPGTGELASGSGDGTVCLWDVTANTPTRRWEAEGGRVFSVAFSRDGDRLATAGDTKEVRVWHAHTGRLEARLTGHERRIWRAVFGTTDDTIVSSGEDNTVRIWNWRTGESRIAVRHGDWVRSVAHHPREPWLASASDDQSVVISHAADGRPIRSWRGWSEPLFSVAFTSSGAVYAAGRRGVCRWNPGQTSPVDVMRRHESRVWALAINDAVGLGASGGDDEVLRLWGVDDGVERAALAGHGKPIWCVAFSPQPDLVASGSEDRTARIWSVTAQRELAVCSGHTSWVRAAAFSPDGSMLATGSDDRTVRLWNTNGEPLRTIDGHAGRVWAVAFHPAGTLLVSAGDEGVVRVWNLHDERNEMELPGHGGRVWSAAFSPDGSYLATSSSDRTVRIWDLAERRLLHVLEGHSRWVRGVAFARDGSMLASASEDGTVRLWDGHTFAFRRLLTRVRPYEGMRIAGARGLSQGDREALLLLGATDEPTTGET